MTDMILPFSEEAEKGVLGSMLIDSERCCPLVMSNRITPDSFYIPAHRHLFEQMMEMNRDGLPIDLLTVGENLKKQGLLDSVGGYVFLEGLIDSTPTSAHAEYYIQSVQNKQMLRNIIECAVSASQQCYDGDDVKEIIGRLSSKLLEIEPQSARRSLYELGEEFISRCEQGIAGTIEHFSPVWTQELGRLSNEIVFIHAPRSSGKTSLLIQWHRALEKLGKKGIVFSLESLSDSIFQRYLAQEGRVNTFAMRKGLYPQHRFFTDSRTANERLNQMNLDILDGSWSIEAIRHECRMAKKRKAQYVMIDNLICIQTNERFDSQQRKYMHMMEQVRIIRNEVDMPVIILAHPNSEGNLKHAGELEDMADIVVYMYDIEKEESRRGMMIGEMFDKLQIEKRNLPENVSQMLVKFQKNREGPTPRLELIFDKEIQTFYTPEEWERKIS